MGGMKIYLPGQLIILSNNYVQRIHQIALANVSIHVRRCPKYMHIVPKIHTWGLLHKTFTGEKLRLF